LAALTEREREVLQLVAEGLSNKEVGARLHLSEKTVKHYMTIVMEKLGVRNRTEAALVVRGREGES
jgi:DNA-binding NarL/FixJ family response regulator